MADLFGMIQNVDKPTFIHHQQRCVSEVHHNYNSPLPLLSTLLQQCPINDWLIEGDLHMFTESVNAKKFKQLKCHIRLLMPEYSWAWCWKFYGSWTKWPVRRKALDWRTIHEIELQYAKDFSIPSWESSILPNNAPALLLENFNHLVVNLPACQLLQINQHSSSSASWGMRQHISRILKLLSHVGHN